MKISLEDNFEDIISKAQAGLQISLSELAEKTGATTQQIQSVKGGQADEAVIKMLAPTLGLNADRLIALAQKAYQPEVSSIEGLAQFNTPFPIPGYEEMTVNAYLAYDQASKEAVVFDTGAHVTEMLQFIEENDLTVTLILLTHSHPDHIYALEKLQKATGTPPTFIHKNESVPATEAIEAGRPFKAGALTIETRLTSGHSPGGCTYVIDGLSQPVAIVGDALFAGSMGGAVHHWQEAIETINTQILALPGNTILCPGHGPLTTVALEKGNNPIF